MNNQAIKLASGFIERNDENGYDAFCDVSQSLYDGIRENPEFWLEHVIPLVEVTPVDYIRRLIESVFEELKIKDCKSLLLKVFDESSPFVKTLILDNLALKDDIDSLNFLDSLEVNDEVQELSKLTALVLIENEIKSGQIESYLRRSYKIEKYSPAVKDRIWNCLKNVYQVSISITDAHKKWLDEKNKTHFNTVILAVKEEYKKGRYKTVVRLLEQFDSCVLSDYAAKILEISKQRLSK